MAENKSAGSEESTTTTAKPTTSPSTTTTIKQHKAQSQLKKNITLNCNILNKSLPAMNATTSSINATTTNVGNKSHALKHSNSTSGQNSRLSSTTDAKHHHHHPHHHHHHHSNPYVIHKTTTESLRLATDAINSTNNSNSNSNNIGTISSSTGNMTVHQLHLSTAPLAIRKPKTSSFQITSVTVGNKLSADNGEDSADDLDESHTDDNSRITDLENETPSVSEDTFSKEDVFFSNNALGTAPVIPTSSQYGLVIVDPDLGGVGSSGQNMQNVHVSVSDAGINIVGPVGSKLGDTDQKELQHRNERFKVVKIESTEPFKRGRWMCMDYLDHTTLQQSTNENNSNEQTNDGNSSNDDIGGGNGGGGGGGGGAGGGTSDTVLTNDSGVHVSENHIDSVGESSDGGNTQSMNYVSPGQTMQHPVSMPAMPTNNSGSGGGAIGNDNLQIHSGNSNVVAPTTTLHAQTLTHMPNMTTPSSIIMQQQNQNVTGHAQSMPQNQIQQAINAGQLPITSLPQSTIQQQMQQTPANDLNSGQPLRTNDTNYVPGQSQPQMYVRQQPLQNVPIVQQVHGATLPVNIQMQNGIPNIIPSQQQQQQQVQPNLPQTMSSVNVSMPVVPSTTNMPIVGETTIIDNINIPSVQPILLQQQSNQPLQQQQQQQQPAINTQTHSAPHTQIAPDIYAQAQAQIQTSSPQSYPSNSIPNANILVAASSIPSNVGGSAIQADVQQQIDNHQQQLNIANQALQSAGSVVVSPSSFGGVGGGVSTNIDPNLIPQSNVTVQSLPNTQNSDVAGASVQISAPSTINEAAVIISNSIQAQQAQLQPGQQVGSDDNQSAQAAETDSERDSRLTVALSKNKIQNSSLQQNIIPSHLNPSTSKEIFTNLSRDESVKSINDNILSIINNSNTKNTTRSIAIPQKNNAGFRLTGFSCSQPERSELNFYSSSFDNSAQKSAPTAEENFNRHYDPNKIQTSTDNSTNLKLTRSSAITSASGTSAVAIDNKIEQAMDLVKSHLMIAVREEVEVLKEKIAELMDRINQLEVENTILKSNISQETLIQLQLQGSVQSGQSTSSTTTTNTISTAPTTVTTNTTNGPVP